MNIKTSASTVGFVKSMATKKFGSYVILGSSGSGRTTILKEYLTSFPANVKSITKVDEDFTDIPTHMISHEMNIVKHLEARPSVIASDASFESREIQDLLTLSALSNTAFTFHANSIEHFITRMRQDADFWMGSRSLMEKIKGLTFTQRVTINNSSAGFLQESIWLNPEITAKFLQAKQEDLASLIDLVIISQGMATIASQKTALAASL